MKVHILGPSGSGTTTLGRMLSERWDIPFFDNDDFFWEETEIPYSKIRDRSERSALLYKVMDENPQWIISGAADKWGEKLLEDSDLIILLYTEWPVREKRLKKREREQFGSRIDPDGDMFENHKAFLLWAEKYDTAGMEQRSRVKLENWVLGAKGKVLYFYNEETPEICNLVTDLYNQQDST